MMAIVSPTMMHTSTTYLYYVITFFRSSFNVRGKEIEQ